MKVEVLQITECLKVQDISSCTSEHFCAVACDYCTYTVQSLGITALFDVRNYTFLSLMYLRSASLHVTTEPTYKLNL